MAIYQNSIIVNQPLLLISGQTPQKEEFIPDLIEDQLDIVIAKIDAILKENNAEISNIAKMNIYITDREYLYAVRSKLSNYLKDTKPAMTLVVVSSLIDPLFKVEMDAAVSL